MIKTPGNIFALDTETTGLWPWHTEHRKSIGLGPDKPFVFTCANGDEESCIIRARVDPMTREVYYDGCKSELRWLREQVSNPKMTIAMHNAPFDMIMCRQVGFDFRCRVEDTMLQSYTCNPLSPHGLKYLAKTHLGVSDQDQKDLKDDLRIQKRFAKSHGYRIANQESHGKGHQYADYWLATPSLLEAYALKDAERTIALHFMFNEVIEQNKREGGKLHEIYKVELEMLEVSLQMELFGITYNHKRSLELMKFYQNLMDVHGQKIERATWKGFKTSSNKHLHKVFIEERGYAAVEQTDGGKSGKKHDKFDGTQIALWERDHKDPLCRDILEWKAAKKAVQELTRYEFFYCKEPGGRCVLHPRWKASGARTGRMACGDPNLMQMTNVFSGKKRATFETRQRECFGPAPGRIWYTIDYSQIEVWLFAFISKDETMQEALLKGLDFHGAIADEVYGEQPGYADDKYPWRRRSKLIMFSRLYGGGIMRVSKLINCTYAEAKEFVEKWDVRLPKVKSFIKRLTAQTQREGIIINAFGREYPVEEDRAYKCVNYTIQGTAAEVMKRSLIRVGKHLRREWDSAGISAAIHDEIIIDLPEEYHSKRLLRGIISRMQADQKALGLPVPLPLKVKVVRTNLLGGKEVVV